ncbi:SDR family oxidoreductase [Methylobacterium gnaphalii]|uniref:Glucose a-dehydrogenase YxnA n=1 Tax=Methylobacterium gnaphalii TaxID=1010610 RepID=A0A512JGI9_9HYPH|nr:SDR family oxidoreductase [Methylobacterium gnaphalii]GEP09079.1 glucose a-dehydrogenase YxnA [Methylobacterium gnaphalii]GJD68391.1 3-phenylpropionate-dihydrodiol/cinnamic acid-dihydrodiol dehydrogenase [Methylobacterium gnaphalii]GLS49003.1 glucose a-dehydrogenase YxnA [Methylobacterium gnaphalii]
MSRRKPLSKQVIVITGASSGIGLTTARMAAARGARVVLAARSRDALAEARAEIERAGGQALDVVADVGRREDVQAVADAAIATFGGFDTWVNVAGLTIYGRLREISDEDHARLLQTNLWGTVFGSLVAVEHLRRRGGTLINVGSVASDLAFPFQGMYAASKHAVKGFTDALRMELRDEGAPVSVTLIKPTSIDTPLPERARNYMDREPTLPPPIYRPEVVAEAILHAAVRPQRDIFVGGSGKALVAMKEFAPGAFDLLAPAIIALQKRAKPPRRPEGALHAATEAGETHGTQPLYAMRTSAYTRASLHPVAVMAGAIGFGLAAAAVSIVGSSISRRDPS